MRNRAIPLLAAVAVGLLGAGAWFLGLWSDTGAVLVDPPVPTASSDTDGVPADDLTVGGATADRMRSPTDAPRNRPRATVHFTVPVMLEAYLEDQVGRRHEALDGFRFRVTNTRGVHVAQGEQTKSGHVLRLGVGSYELTATLGGFQPGAPARFTITRQSEPVTVHLPFSKAGATLSLEVLDRATRRRISRFRLTIDRDPAGAPPVRTEFVSRPEGNPATILATRGARVVVKVEAKGYEPGEPLTVVFEGAVDRLERQVFLAPAMEFAGVEVAVVDERNRKVTHLLVDTKKRDEAGTFRPLWRRRSKNPDGVFKLPDLAPGVYRMRLRALDDGGLGTLHLAHDLELTFTGNEHVREPVVLHLGAGLELKLTDPQNRTIGKDVSIRLTWPDGKVHESVWRPVAGGEPDPKGRLSADHLLEDRAARLEHAVPAGNYTIRLQWADGPPVQRTVFLRAGEVTAVDLTLAKRR